jgi:phage-related protein
VLALPEGLKARYFRLIDTMKQHGANLGKAHTKPMGNDLFELRISGKEGIARVMYCTLIGKRIIMLHCFIKKTQKTPRREIDAAMARLKEVKKT